MPRYSEEEARAAIATSRSWTAALRALGMCHTGGAAGVLKKYVVVWEISTEHFDFMPVGGVREAIPLARVLVTGSTYNRGTLKQRLRSEGLLRLECSLSGQGATWRDRPMSLVLDHVNGVRDDNRLENLRLVCPNCNATLDTHCGKNVRRRPEQDCEHCAGVFRPRKRGQRFCSRRCGVRHNAPELRRAARPPYGQLMREIEAASYSAVGRRYGVSDNAIRKWVLAYRREAASLASAA